MNQDILSSLALMVSEHYDFDSADCFHQNIVFIPSHEFHLSFVGDDHLNACDGHSYGENASIITVLHHRYK